MKKIKKYQTRGVVQTKDEFIPYTEAMGMDYPIQNPFVEESVNANMAYNQDDIINNETIAGTKDTKLKNNFNPFVPNNLGLGLMGAYIASRALLNKQNDRNYEAYKNRWLRNYTMPSTLIDPYKHGDVQSEMPIYQKGGRTPIYTDNPNDPRLRAYNDSLSAYNWGEKTYKKVIDSGLTPSGNPVYSVANRSTLNKSQEIERRLRTYKSMGLNVTKDDILEEMDNLDSINKGTGKKNNAVNFVNFQKKDNEGIYSLHQYKKPVQPVVYQPEPKFEKPIPIPKKTRLVDFSSGRMPIPSAPDLQQAVYDNTKPTNYSYTYPTGKYNEQKVIYFPDENLLRNFADKQATTSMQSTGNQATATGYLKKDGGISIDPSKKGTFKAQATRMGMSVQEAANKILSAPKGRYSAAMRKKANFAKNFAKEFGGLTMETEEDQGLGYFKYPSASYLKFPGTGERTFVPGPFPLLVKDDNGVQLMNKKPVKTKGSVMEIPLYEQGGDIQRFVKKVNREKATIEAEKGELIFGAGAPTTLDDQETRVGVGLFRVGGKKHSDGGTPVNATPGDFVFSDHESLAFSEEKAKDLIGKVIKQKRFRTPAKLASRYLKLNDYLTMAQDDEMDKTSKKTAALNINNFIDRLAEIAYAQEQLKGFPNGLPNFASVSLSTRGFDVEGLQHSLNNNVFQLGGELPKYQTTGLITDDIRKKGIKKEKPDPGFEEYARINNEIWYRKPGVPPTGKFTPGKFKEQDIFKMLDLYGNRTTNRINNLTYDELLANRAVGIDTEEARKYWNEKYYNLGTDDEFQYTASDGSGITPAGLGELPRIRTPKIEGMQPPVVPPKFGSTEDALTLDNYTSIPNTKFNLNAAEAYGLYAAVKPYPSRYPTAFRNYEISDAEALVSNSYRPISEQPYLNAIKRQTLGFDQNNNASGAAGFTRSLGAFQAALGASNQAIEGVYNQNISRRDAQMNALAQLRIQNGIDRVSNAKEYDTKLETLNNNKELAAKYRDQNVSTLLNQMQRDRESMAMFNNMSEYYQINQDRTFGLKPVYKVENGKLTRVDRNIGDLIKNTRNASNPYVPMMSMVQNLRNAGFSEEQISRMVNLNPLRDQN